MFRSRQKTGAIVENVKTIEIYAAKGVASLRTLQQRFDKMASEIVKAGQKPVDGGLLDIAIHNLKAPFQWRRTGNIEGAEVDAVVARAEVNIQNGDLSAALMELKALTGKGREAAESWMVDAEALVKTDQALGKLQIRAIALLKSATE